MNILKTLSKLKSSADFEAALSDLESEFAVAKAAIAALEVGCETAIFSGGDVAQLDADILAAESRAKTLATAITGATRRREEAAEAEVTAALRATAKAAEKLNAKLSLALADFTGKAETLASAAETVTSLRRAIAPLNRELQSGGRADLMARDAVTIRAREAGQFVVDPLAGLSIHNHWPRRTGFAPLAKAG